MINYTTMKKTAFTMLEMLLALAISGILMLAVLAVVSGFGPVVQNDEGFSTKAEIPDANTMRYFADVLADDISLSQNIDLSVPNRITIRGFVALDKQTRNRTHRAAEAVYYFKNISGRRWLIRRQRVLDLLDNQNIFYDFVCCDVGSFELLQFGGDDTDSSGAMRWVLRVNNDDSSSKIYEKTLAVTYGAMP